jgi:hypothetical protein
MTEIIIAAVCGVLAAWLVLLLPTLRSPSLSKPEVRPRKDEARTIFRAFADTAAILGVHLMSALDDALARFTTFVKDVVAQLKVTRDTNDTQTGKLAELQAALDVALSDDATDKAAITALQVEIATLQDTVAAQINAAVDALESAPTPAELVVVEDVPVVVEAGPVVEEEVVVVEGAPVVEEVPVVEGPVVDDTVVVVDEAVVSDVK